MTSKYLLETELKKRIKQAGLGYRDIAMAIGDPPQTLAQRLNGWLPLSPLLRNKINKRIQRELKEVSTFKSTGGLSDA
jgi:hypothetical protein